MLSQRQKPEVQGGHLSEAYSSATEHYRQSFLSSDFQGALKTGEIFVLTESTIQKVVSFVLQQTMLCLFRK